MRGLFINGNLGGGARLVLEFSIATGGRPCWRAELEIDNDRLVVTGARSVGELIAEVGNEIGVREALKNASFTAAQFTAFAQVCQSVYNGAHAQANVTADVIYH